MPILTLPGLEAHQNLSRPGAIWPKRGRNNRKAIMPLPMVEPSFTINQDDHVFCMGSCFAQHVGDALANQGFDVVTRCENPHTTGAWGWSNHLIRYNMPMILNEFRWALLGTESFPYECFSEDEGGGFRDHFGHVQEKPRTLAELRTLRDFTFSVTRRLKESRIVVMTMGLVEVWYDRKAGLYSNMPPPDVGLLKEPERYEFRVLSHDEVLEVLESIHSLLTAHGHPDFKILITTSPVPLHATMTGKDVFTANMYSKSVQRAVVEAFVLRHDNVNYFPSYEAVMLGDSDFVWTDDQRHVRQEMVSAIMEHVLRHYTTDRDLPTPYLRGLEAQVALRQQIQEQMAGANVNTLAVLANNQLKEIQALKAELAEMKKRLGV